MARVPLRWRRVIAVLVVAQLVVLVTLLALRAAGAGEATGSNGELRGSKPPDGARMPDLSHVIGVEPRLPGTAKQRGKVQVLVATCIAGSETADCRSGDVVGGFLGRLDMADIPEGVELRAVVWGFAGGQPDIEGWRSEWNVPDQIVIHVAGTGSGEGDGPPGGSSQVVMRELGVGESGVLIVGDRLGRWRSTFHLGQLDREDLMHDLDQLSS